MKITLSFFPALLAIVCFSCAHTPYGRGDRYFAKKEYAKAMTLYMNSEKERANEILRSIDHPPADLQCDFFELKMKIASDLDLLKKDAETIGLLERYESLNCGNNEDLIEKFYSGLRKLLGLDIIRAGDRFFIKGSLKKNIGDKYSALEYFKMGLRVNPKEEVYLQILIATFRDFLKEIDSKMDRRQIPLFLVNDYPQFFSFISELYFRNPRINIPFTDKTKNEFSELTKEFTSVKATQPITLFTNLNFQNQNSLILTIPINQIIKISKIGDLPSKNYYIVYAPKETLVGFSGEVEPSSFAEIK